MLHALGFHHEHGRPDRDDYIDILWQNVIPGMEHAFQKYSWNEVTAFGVAYNTKSIMHYDNYAFSNEGQPTILVKVCTQSNCIKNEFKLNTININYTTIQIILLCVHHS
ncbi:unnamed protein product [Orchesella dallaii]|uniref:Metalloendopeptidase n=1 Tax=Orchesella dallaii TaxID=48710 RepID=A0ABP1QRQ0_9HEXA